MAMPQSVQQHLLTSWPFLLGNVLEWYDFGVYGYLATELEAKFFHNSAIATWVGFTVTFVLRPIGGTLNGWLADCFGRRVAVMLSLIGMLVATVGQGLLPTETCCGSMLGTTGVCILYFLRALQGLSAGGELGAIVPYFAEQSPSGWTHTCVGVLFSLAIGGLLLGNVVVATVVKLLGHQAMLAWGWRLPFLLALPGGLLSLWGRSKVPESQQFVELESHQGDKSAPTQGSFASLWAHKYSVLFSFAGCAPYAVAYYSGIWCLSYLTEQGTLEQGTSLLVGCVFNAVIVLSCPVWSFLNDTRFKVDPLDFMLIASVGLAVAGICVFICLSRSWTHMFLASVLALGISYGSILGFMGSVMYVFVADNFPTEIRALGFGFSFNMAFASMGGSASLVNIALTRTLPHVGPGLYWTIVAGISAALLSVGKYSRLQGVFPNYLFQDQVKLRKQAASSCDRDVEQPPARAQAYEIASVDQIEES